MSLGGDAIMEIEINNFVAQQQRRNKMAFEPKDGMGSLFKNDKKGNDKAPDYRGDVMVDGKVYQLAGWKKLTSKGDGMLSLSIKHKEDYKKEEKPKIDPDKPFDDFDSSIPF